MKKRKKAKSRPAAATKSRKKRAAAASLPPAPVTAPVTAPGLPDILGEAARALQAGRPADAMGLAAKLLATEPDNADALNLAGVAAFQLGDAAEARSLLETAVAFRPDFADAFNNLGNVLKEDGLLADAKAAYARALKVRPGYLDAQYNLGITLELQGRFADAEAQYRRCLETDFNFHAAHFNLGNVLKALGRLGEAEAAYRRVLDAEPTHARALNNLGAVAMELGRAADAMHAYRQAIGIDPDFAEAHYNLGIALQADGDGEEAMRCYERALQCDPGHAGAQVNIGYALNQMGRLDDAIAAYARAIEMAPDYDKVRTNLGDVYLEQGKPDLALSVCDDYLGTHPGSIAVLAFKAIVLRELGLTDAVADLYDFDRLLRPVTIAAPGGFDDLAAFNAALTEHVLGHPSLVPAPLSHATRNGRHSGELLAEPKGPMAALETAILAAVEGYRAAVPTDPDHPYLARRPDALSLNVWGVAMDRQGHQVAHIHPSAWLSGVYYPRVPDAIAAGDPGHAGWIEFGRAPDDFHATKEPRVTLIRPEEGLMLLFPPYFYHRTVPFQSDDVRVSIAFDVLAGD